jgi:hypothetical protein
MSEFKRPAVFLDACVLVGAMRRHLVLALAERGLLYPRWSEKVMLETGHAHAKILDGKPGRDGAGEAAQLVMHLQAAFPEAMVPTQDAEQVSIKAQLPDPNDAHVIQAAIAGQSTVILTENMKDFPRQILQPLGIYARPTHEFVASMINRAPETTLAAINTARERLDVSPARFGDALRKSRLGALAKKLAL